MHAALSGGTLVCYNLWCHNRTTVLRVSHTIATTSRRPLTTTFFGVVAGGCQRSANVCRWSPTSRRLVVRELHRQPLADLRQPLFMGWFSEFFGGRQMIVDDRRPVGDWLSEQFVGERISLQHRKPFADQTSRRNFLNIVWSATVLRSIGDQSPTSLQCLPSLFLVSNNKTATKE